MYLITSPLKMIDPMQLKISNTQPQELVKQLAAQLNVSTQDNCIENNLELTTPLGEGKITGYNFSGGLGILVLYCKLKEDWELIIKQKQPALQFNFCMGGNARHFLQNNELQYQLLPLQGSITANKVGHSEHFFFTSAHRTHFYPFDY